MFFARLLVAAGAIAFASADLLPKGGLYGPADALRQAIHDKMEAMPGSVVQSRNPVAVPPICNEITTGWGVNEGGDQTCEGGLEAMEVKYDDCDQPWTLCRCGNANLSWDTLIDRVGKVPPAARSYVRVIIAIHADGCSGLCFNGEIIRLNGDCDQFVLTHEVGHAVDKGYPEWQPFLDGVNRDSCVADEYGNNNLAENFAQMFSLVTSTWYSGSVDRDISCLQGQFDTLWNDWRIQQALGAPSCLPERRPALFAPNSAKFASSIPSKESLNVTLPSGPNASLHHEQFTFHRYY